LSSNFYSSIKNRSRAVLGGLWVTGLVGLWALEWA